MSHYTTEVRYICEVAAGYTESQGYSSVETILQKAWGNIFQNFPLFDESYRSVLCQKILRHYYTREICCETVGLWKLWLNTKMMEIMPYYNQLYKSAAMEFNPLENTDYTRKGNRQGTGSEDTTGTSKDDRTSTQTRDTTLSSDSTSTDTHTNTNRDLYSDTPQGALTGVENEEYLTNARKISDSYSGDFVENRDTSEHGATSQTDAYTGSTTGTKDSSTTEEYLETISGKMGGESYANLIMEYRQSLINIDMMIIDELKDLFFQLY